MTAVRRQFETSRAAAEASLARVYGDLLAARDAVYADVDGPDDWQRGYLLSAMCAVQSARRDLRSARRSS